MSGEPHSREPHSGQVVHVLGPHPYDRYVGRPNSRYKLSGSSLANPHKIGEGVSRQRAITLFEMGLRASAVTDPAWRKRVLEVRGMTLACWCCEPRDRILTTEDETVCHAQIILRVADELARTLNREEAS